MLDLLDLHIKKSHPKSPKYRSLAEQFPANEVVCNENGLFPPTTGKVLVITDEATNNTNMESLDQQVKSMMLFSENANPYGMGRARICKVCGKEGSYNGIVDHIEANHIAGISIPCGLCDQVVKTRNAMRKHKLRHHGNQ